MRFRVTNTIVVILVAWFGIHAGPAAARGFALPAASFATGGAGLTSFYIIGFELGPWQEYLARELTPSYMVPEGTMPVRISWLDTSELSILPDFAQHLVAKPQTYLRLEFDWQSSSQFSWPQTMNADAYRGSTFERSYFAPGFEHQLDSGGILGVSAVIAYQSYGAANLGLRSMSGPDDGSFGANPFAAPTYSPYRESAYGTGVRLALHQEVIKGFALNAGFQSRIDMEEFAAYRGVYSQPADLDIPARARFGLEVQASKRSWLTVSVERVMYSQLTAFASRNLPDKLLSLLGDSTSPNFAWQDLTIYSVGWTWSDGLDHQLYVDFSTRPQPSPTSVALSQALENDLANSAVVLGYSRRTSNMSRLNFNAAYAPSEFAFGGSVLGITTDHLGPRLELEAMWTLNF